MSQEAEAAEGIIIRFIYEYTDTAMGGSERNTYDSIDGIVDEDRREESILELTGKCIDHLN